MLRARTSLTVRRVTALAALFITARVLLRAPRLATTASVRPVVLSTASSANMGFEKVVIANGSGPKPMRGQTVTGAECEEGTWRGWFPPSGMPCCQVGCSQQGGHSKPASSGSSKPRSSKAKGRGGRRRKLLLYGAGSVLLTLPPVHCTGYGKNRDLAVPFWR